MSFGEHLEELRSALWKAVIAIFLGFLVGLLVGDKFVRFVKAPLEQGLKELEQNRKQAVFNRDEGESSPTEQSFAKRGLVPEHYVLDAESLITALRGSGVTVDPPADAPGQVDLWMWTKPRDAQLISTGTPDVFSVYVKASLVLGTVLASPAVFYFLWAFVAAGLYPHEKRYVHVFMPFSIGLFLLGAVVAFYVVLKYVISFLLGFNEWMGIEATPRINEWLSFVLILPLMFGVAFQMPLVMLFLDRIGVASTAMYIKYWRYAVLIIFVVSMILTPADPQSLLAMAGCLTPLYFGGILLCKWMPRSAKPFSESLGDA
ncbi:twin-arginine translocase subunit TatC [Botrimarina colliarenosi]|nr:twin-arginine translocase subunit TatC [Botrimarina colliarenosi]